MRTPVQGTISLVSIDHFIYFDLLGTYEVHMQTKDHLKSVVKGAAGDKHQLQYDQYHIFYLFIFPLMNKAW